MIRRATTTAATSSSARMATCTSASAMAAAAAITHGTIGNGQLLTTLLGKMLRIDVAQLERRRDLRHPGRAIRSPANARCNANGNAPARRTARRSTPTASAIPGAGASIASAASCGSTTSGRARWRKSTRSRAAATTAGAASKATTGFNTTCGPNPSIAIAPIAQYGRSLGQSTTGGFVYRGSAIPSLIGRYVFADFATGNIWHIARDTPPTLTLAAGTRGDTRSADRPRSRRTPTASCTSCISAARCTSSCPTAVAAAARFPHSSPHTGCVNPANPTQPASGLIPYAPNAPFFSDGAIEGALAGAARRSAHHRRRDHNDFDFPNGSVLVKNFSLGGQPGRDAPVHAPHRRQLGRLHLRMERAADRSDARDRRQDRAGRRPDLGIPERGAMPAMPHRRRGPHAGPGDRPAQWRLRPTRPRAAPPISSPRSISSTR